MNKIVFLLVLTLVFAAGCGKKVETPVSEEITSEDLTTPIEAQAPQTTDAMQQQIAGTPITQIPAAEGVPLEISSQAVTSEKPTVENIQQALKNAGLYIGKIDGKLGPKTKKAIEEFQKQNNLKADGKVGPKTWDKLKAYLTQAGATAGQVR